MIATLLPATVRGVEAYGDVRDEPPFPGEADLVAAAVEGRRREFVTTRRCARQALAQLGLPPVAIRPGPGRAPRWPTGVVGSLTHCTGYRAAAVARAEDVSAVGIDGEPHAPLPGGVLESVVVPGETEMLRRITRVDPTTHWDRLLFSAKESVYKAWFPLTGRWLGFEDARLEIDPHARTFTAHLRVAGHRLDGASPLTSLAGSFLVGRGLVLTAVVVEPRA
ncbi:4'-phosphopantetheinyl transferase family protein [Myceligenerans pegani]|uniref:4'-phosphopantetheinyl transferase superfamily protein n=1 Tax=Myceligenerans pegani TaxID=2776917 RepID=A0ABR9MZA4_9MICO|nr:4'-phosphopantetheinyl transferase superfamily protein [Myceligenerans sp. TRM 65318]MBE1876188.1 4'-phosphopantetheinyl transferase superfamily protein [Myceligenerans sp. TRM 65318]MBE3018459.1 4'-phosphopantetheinyl transferase superfamily protein [Myceligenerans sp. TRM 65318]